MWRRTTTTALVATGLVFGLTLAVLAKGPATGTLTGPGINEPIEFLDQTQSRPFYEIEPPTAMIGVTGLWTPARTSLATAPSEDPGEAYTVTWVNLGPPDDSIEERTIVQHIYLDAAGGALIHTPGQVGLDGWGDGVVGWVAAPENIDEAIEEVVAWGETETRPPAWLLPVIALVTIAGLAALGHRLDS